MSIMKKLILVVLIVACALDAHALEGSGTTTAVNQIIAIGDLNKSYDDDGNSQRAIWGKTTFINISYNKTKFKSSEFPSTAGAFEKEYDNDLGVGIQWGHTFNLHRNPVGSVMFFGLDFTWLDMNFNRYKKVTLPDGVYTRGEQVWNLPWHHEKLSLNYGMSLGPSLTLYPFATSDNNSSKLRLHVYCHVGYGIEGVMLKDVMTNIRESQNEYAYGHGLFMSYGASLSWNFIGVGYEFRHDDNLKFKAVETEFDTGKMKAKEKTSRVYLQFRF